MGWNLKEILTVIGTFATQTSNVQFVVPYARKADEALELPSNTSRKVLVFIILLQRFFFLVFLLSEKKNGVYSSTT